jgi:NADPH-dependent 2,4-dienoyl-CoA reductase/sulfur reductase-like enzyme
MLDVGPHPLTLSSPRIVVAGGGTAGCAAAIAAARRGHRVLLVEEGNCLGGVSTAGGVNEWFASLEGLGDVFESVKTELALSWPNIISVP